MSFAGLEDYSDIDTRPRRFYAIVKSGETNGQFIVESVRPVPYQTVRKRLNLVEVNDVDV